jgi:hypothetical protein
MRNCKKLPTGSGRSRWQLTKQKNNGNEIGMPVNQDLIHPVERIHNEGETKNFKLLGVLFDEYLSFDDHITDLCAKISKSLFCINRIKNFVNQDTLKTLYFAMVHFNLVYCSNIYSCSNTTSLNKLRVKQKQAVRNICNAGVQRLYCSSLCTVTYPPTGPSDKIVYPKIHA